MVNLRSLKKVAERAKKTIDERGGTDALKEDADELKEIAKGKGSVGDKAKKAASEQRDVDLKAS